MKCVVNQTIYDQIKKGESLEAIKAYVKEKYNLTIEIAALRRRLRHLTLDFPS